MDSKREGNLGHTVGVKLGRFSLVLAALFVVASFAAPADAGVQWVTRQVGWAGPGAGTILGSGGLDTLIVTDEADTNRTVVISTAKWAWESLLDRSLTASAPNPDSLINAMLVIVTAQKANAASLDTVWVTPEACYRGTCSRVSMAAAASWPLTLVTNTANGGPIAYTRLTPPGAVFMGFVKIDPNSVYGSGNVLYRPEMRLLVTGDVSASSPELKAARIYVVEPLRTVP